MMRNDSCNEKKLSKKAQLEISFNWIFILLAGGAVLIFFIFVITKETNQSEQFANLQVVKRMDSLLTAIEQNPVVEKDLGYMRYKIKFACQDGLHVYALQEGKNNPELKSQLVFTPDVIGESNLWAWTQDYNSPYPVSSLLYLSDSKTMYVFEDTLPDELFNDFSSNFTKVEMRLAEMSSLTDLGMNKYVFVLTLAGFNSQFRPNLIQSPDDLENSIKMKSSFVVLDYSTNFYPGKVSFYRYVDSAKAVPDGFPASGYESPYTSKEMLYGAIITGEKSLYDCVLNKLMTRTIFVDKLNIERLSLIKNELSSSDTICRTYMGVIAQNSISRKRLAATDFFNFELDNNNLANYQHYYQDEQALRTIRDEMIRQGCPSLY